MTNNPKKPPGLDSKTKAELIEEIIKLKKDNDNSTPIQKVDINQTSELYKLIADNSHDGIIIIGDEYKIEYLNKQAKEFTGKSASQMLNKDFIKYLKHNENDQILDRLSSRREGTNFEPSYELLINTTNNEKKYIEVRSSVFKDFSEKTKTFVQLKDITEQKFSEDIVKQSEEKFRSIVENSHLGIFMLNTNFQFEYLNDQCCKILGTPKHKLQGGDFRKVVSKESLKLVVERYKKRQKGITVPSEYEIKLLRPDGEIRIVKLSSTVVKFNNEIKTMAQVLDITENARKENLQSTLFKISQAVNEVKNLNEFLKIVRDVLSNILNTTNFYVALYDKNSDTYTFPYHVDEYDSIDEITQLELKDSLTDYVRRKNKAILVNATMQEELERKGEITGIVGEYSPVWLGAPLVVDNVVVGVIGLQNYHREDSFNQSDLELLQIISENVSAAIWKKEIADKLIMSEHRYRDFISRSSEGIYRIDFDPAINIKLSHKEQAKQIFKYGSIGECNNSFAKMYDFKSFKDLVGRNLNIFYDNKISQKNFNVYLDFIKNKYQVSDVETTEVTSKNKIVRISNNSIGIIKDGYLNNIWGIQKDVTESKRLQNALQQIAEGISSSVGDSFFKSLVHFLGETLKVDFSFIARLTDNGKSAESLAFWEKDKFIENFSYELKNTPSKQILSKNKTTIINNVQDVFPNDELLKRLKASTYIGRPLIDSEGKSIGIIVILQQGNIENIVFTKSVLDIFATRSAAEIERLQYVKEIVSAKDDAERSNGLKSDFLAQMSHEIRTPVNTILSFSSLLKESLEDQLDEDLKDSFKIIENGGRRLIRTIDLILNVSQIQSGNLTLTPTKVDLITVLENLVSEFGQEADKKKLGLSFSCKENELNIFADSYTITQIFANIIHNSIKYTEKGNVRVIARINSKNDIVVKVKDSGVGMSDDYIKEIFDPFSQEETGYTRKFEGTGLGLTLVRNYCKLNNAEISVKSEKNKGSTFSVVFKK